MAHTKDKRGPREHTTVTEFYSGSMLGRVWMGYRAVQTASITQAELDGLGIDAAGWFASAKYHGDFESIDDFQYSRTERRVTVLINPVTDAIIGMDTEERTRVIREESEDWPSPFDDDESEEG